MFCIKCAEKLDADANFCGSCGHKLTDWERAKEPAAEITPPEPVTSPSEPEWDPRSFGFRAEAAQTAPEAVTDATIAGWGEKVRECNGCGAVNKLYGRRAQCRVCGVSTQFARISNPLRPTAQAAELLPIKRKSGGYWWIIVLMLGVVLYPFIMPLDPEPIVTGTPTKPTSAIRGRRDIIATNEVLEYMVALTKVAKVGTATAATGATRDRRDIIATSDALKYMFALTKVAKVDTVTPTKSEAIGRDNVYITTSLDTTYFTVTGITTEAIDASIGANTPLADSVGLAEAEWFYDPTGRDYEDYCEVESVNIDLQLVVTLPRHLNPERMTPAMSSRWGKLVKDTREHEHEHVDIYVETTEAIRSRIAQLPHIFTNCDEMFSAIDRIHDDLMLQDDRRQDAFHASEERLCEQKTRPITQKIEVREMQISNMEISLQSYASRMDDIEKQYPDRVLPQRVYDEYGSLEDSYNLLWNEYDASVDELEGLFEEEFWAC